LEGSSRGLIEEFTWETEESHENPGSRDSRVLAEIQTEDIWNNTSLEQLIILNIMREI
jgi:hypothetical protein